MADIPDYTLKPTFPVASVIDAAQRNNALQQQALEYNQRALIQGLSSIGQVGESLYQRKQAMAQALAGSKMFAASPEGQQMLGTNTVAATSPTGQPITQNSTAAYNPATGTVTPNKSGVTMGDLQTAFMGESPSNLMTQLFQRQKERAELGLKTREEQFKEQFEPLRLASNERTAQTLAGIKSTEVSNTAKAALRSAIATQQARQQDAIKKFPDLLGSMTKGILPQSDQEKAALKDYQDAQTQIDSYTRELNGGGTTNSGGLKHASSQDLLARYQAITAQNP